MTTQIQSLRLKAIFGLVVTTFVTGCAGRAQFRVAVADHAVQTGVIVRWCETNRYNEPCDADLVEDLRAMHDQATAILRHVEALQQARNQEP